MEFNLTRSALTCKSQLTSKLAKIILQSGFFAFVVIFAPLVPAQGETDPFEVPIVQLSKVRPENVVRFKALAFDVDAASGQVTRARIALDTREGFKLYSKGLRFEHESVAAPFPETMAFTADPQEKVIFDEWYKEQRGVFYAGTVFTVTAKNPINASDKIRVRFEACSVASCLLPTYFVFPSAMAGSLAKFEKQNDELELGVAKSESPLSGGAANQPVIRSQSDEAKNFPREPVNTSVSADVSFADKVSLWVSRELAARSFLLFPALFLAGLLMNATPCVYPVIPITINVLSRFGAGHPPSADERRRRRHLLPFVYVLGMVISYSLMGVVAAMSGGIFGGLLQNVWVTFAVAALMFVMGLWMLGVFNSNALQNFAHKLPVSEKHPVVGVATMGAVSGLVSAPCTGPVLSTLLLLIGQTKDPVFGFTLMVFFALGFGAPYIVLGLVSQQIKRLPRVGGALEWVKFVFAGLMFALSLYYLKPLIGHALFVSSFFERPNSANVVSVALFVVVCGFVMKQAGFKRVFGKVGAIVALTQLGLWLTLFVTSGFVRASSVEASAPAQSETVAKEIVWEKDWRKAVMRASVENKPLVVDAWAEWCAACLQMDETVWKDPKVVQIVSQHFVAAKIDFTRTTPVSNELTKRWDLTGLPAVGFFKAGAKLDSEMPAVLYREQIDVAKFFDAAMKVRNP